MISPPNNPQPVVFNINNTHGNNYVNHGVRSQTPETTGEECAQAGHVLAPRSPLCEAQKMDKSSTTSNNLMGFPEGEDTNSLNKEIGTSSNGLDSPNRERDLEYTTDPNHPSIAAQKKIVTTTDGLGMVARPYHARSALRQTGKALFYWMADSFHTKRGVSMLHMQQNTGPIMLISFLA